MKDFSNIKFQGVFRIYQQRVLDNADTHLKDGKINIVAAPGSGKTVLGLELIRRLNSPCIVFSPTTSIREQWGARFNELFVKDKKEFEKCFSNDLHNIKLINSITYQALYSAMEKVYSKDDDEEVDYSDIDMFKVIKNFGIKTICLDEAHHLQNKWQNSLEKFLAKINKDITIISLTATPPYDASEEEWKRYKNVCGEIDEEIFVPELVVQGTLCPHQDYVYFNYPTANEIYELKKYKNKAKDAINEFSKLTFLRPLCKKICSERYRDNLFTNIEKFSNLMALFDYFGIEVDKDAIKTLCGTNGLPKINLRRAEIAIQFLLDSDIIDEEKKLEIENVLKKHSVFHNKKVALHLNDKLERSLVSSVGKLESIKEIVKSEYQNTRDDTRMLILTDYIKKERVVDIGTEESFNSINIVSIFETLRRDNNSYKMGVLSGSLIILPDYIDLTPYKCKKKKLENTDYNIVDFKGSNHESVAIVGDMLKRGELHILIGTKSLLGEGWDSPCINSLILASFVGSYVLSNQMRGRAIRIDKTRPNKVANIWHLITLEPDYMFKNQEKDILSDEDELTSYDYGVLKRRFDAFIGPNYTTGDIEGGIERITTIKPPYSSEGVAKINEKMLEFAKERQKLSGLWKFDSDVKESKTRVESTIPIEKKPKLKNIVNIPWLIVLILLEILCLNAVLDLFTVNYFFAGVYIFFAVILFVYICRMSKKLICHITATKSIQTFVVALCKTLKLCKVINEKAVVKVAKDSNIKCICVYLENASIHEQTLFNTAIKEFFSRITEPKYALVKKNMFKANIYEMSFACPNEICEKKKYAENLAKCLKTSTANFGVIYIKGKKGKEELLQCRRSSYLTFGSAEVGKRYKVYGE